MTKPSSSKICEFSYILLDSMDSIDLNKIINILNNLIIFIDFVLTWSDSVYRF